MGNFWKAQGLPKSSPNPQQSQKSAKKSTLKKHMFFNTFFSRIFLVWASENGPKPWFFCYFFEKVDLVKIVLPSRRNCYFSGSEPQKNDQKSMPKRARKKHRKNISQKLILASIWGSKALPKFIEKRKRKKLCLGERFFHDFPWFSSKNTLIFQWYFSLF